MIIITTQQNIDAIGKILKIAERGDTYALSDCFELVKALEADGKMFVDGQAVFNESNFEIAHSMVKSVRAAAVRLAKTMGGDVPLAIYKSTLLFDAPYFFDEAIRYAEFERPYKKRFYEPRRKQLLPVVRAMEDLEKRKIKLLLVMLPPGCGKTTLEIMFLRWFGGKHPELCNLTGSHSNSILQGMYGELQRMCEGDSEYLWNDIFPNAELCSTDAKNMRLDLGVKKRFSTYQFASVGAGNAGRVRASGLLCLDDLVPDLESSLSRERMDKLWQQYNTDYLQRTIGDCVQLMIQTPWSLFDPIDRLAEMHENDDEARIVRLPALDENDESNFDYPFSLGFSTKKYHEIREVMDDASWSALYQLTPREREGVLYSPEELRRYYDLPDREPDAIISVCDIADGGGDAWCAPIVYQYGNDYYIADLICDSGKPEIVEERIVEKYIKHKVNMAQFESNRGGGRVAETIQKKIKEKNGITKITTKWNETQKATRLIMNSPWVKDHCLFLSDGKCNKEYKTFLRLLCSYTMSGRNAHDDAPDSMSMLAEFSQSFGGNVVSVYKRPF